jgi:hypothetical protein
MQGVTKKLSADYHPNHASEARTTELDRRTPRPWRIALKIMTMGITLVCDLSDTIIVGRSYPQMVDHPNIDLAPYNAQALGVSRHHLTLKLHDNCVVVIDNHSANKTLLNNEVLRPGEMYQLHHGDSITLGSMTLRSHFLTNPFDW